MIQIVCHTKRARLGPARNRRGFVNPKDRQCLEIVELAKQFAFKIDDQSPTSMVDPMGEHKKLPASCRTGVERRQRHDFTYAKRPKVQLIDQDTLPSEAPDLVIVETVEDNRSLGV